jgi:hypothetical protein
MCCINYVLNVCIVNCNTAIYLCLFFWLIASSLLYKSVATNFCVVINEDNGLDDDSHNAILEFILIFEV